MDLLFKNTADVKAMVGWLYASTNFEALKPDLESATEDVCNVIGEDVYNRARDFYTTPLTGSGSGIGVGSGSGSGIGGLTGTQINEQLVKLIQMPIALLAILSFVENSDISHESDGRKVKVNKETESLPWEWMVERDNAAILKKANRSIDRLVAFLDKYDSSISEWHNSDQRKDMKSLFVPDAATFDALVPIDKSRVFFLRTLPFNRKEDRNIRALLLEAFDSLKTAMSGEADLTADQKKMLDLCQEVVVYGTMAKAVRLFSVKILPDSVVQRFDSSAQTQKASKAATAGAIASMEKIFLEDKTLSEKALASMVRRKAGINTESIVKDYSNDKFFSA